MSYKRNDVYRAIPLSCETPSEDFYIYDNIRSLRAKCESNKDKIVKIRTVGVFITENGNFYVKEIVKVHDQSISSDPILMQVSLAYMKSLVTPPNIPYPVQIIGQLQWKQHPVIFALIIEPLKATVAIVLQETLNNIAGTHLHRDSPDINALHIQEDDI